MKRFFSIILTLLCSFAMMAQRPHEATEEALKAGEGEINRQQEFFDPTRKVEKKREDYHFGVEHRFEVGYVQNQQRSLNLNWNDPFLHGIKLGYTVDFLLPYHFSLQTGVAFCSTFGRVEQHWHSQTEESTQVEYLRHGINQYYVEIPVRAYYTQKLWRDLNLFFYGGPKLEIGLAQLDFVHDHLSDATREWLVSQAVPVNNYDRYRKYVFTDKDGVTCSNSPELHRCNIQLGVGGGLEWAQYRLVAGYDFGLNNLVATQKTSKSHMWEWGWYVSFAYRF